MSRKKKVLSVLGMAILCSVLFASPLRMQASEPDTIAEGVYIGSIDVGGMTEEEAVAAIESYMTTAGGVQLTLCAGERSVEVTAADLGIEFINTRAVQEAMDIGRSGSLIRRYKDKKDLENSNKIIDMWLDVDTAAVNALLEEKVEELNQAAVDGGLLRENGEFKIIPGEQGIEVNISDSINVIEDFISGEWDGTPAEVALVADIVEPRGTMEELSQVTDVLGTFTTSYNDSTSNRASNIAVATGFVNGTLLYPGDEFSVGQTISPLNAANGYKLASAFENGQTVDAYGGGVCQVSTTLYNAAILAELEIAERSNHSMVVSYVQPAMDAAIAGDYKDLRLVNNQELPIYIEGYTVGKNVYFTIYGHETRPANRAVRFESEVVSQQDPGTQFVATGDPVGYIGTAQSKHVGYVARLWKIVTVDGVEESREVFNQSSYRASPKVVNVGTASEDPNVSAIVGAAIASGDEAAIYNAIAPYSAAVSAVINPAPAPSPEEQANMGM